MPIPSFCDCYCLWVFPRGDRGQATSRVQGHASGAPDVDNREQVLSVYRPALQRGDLFSWPPSLQKAYF